MKRFRWPRRTKPSANGTPPGSSSLLRLLSLLAVLVVGFFAGLYLFFPGDILAQRLEQAVASRTPVRVRIGNLDLTFPPGLSAERVRLSGELPLEGLSPLDRVTAKPLWSSLLQGRPGVALMARRGDGVLNLDLVRNGALTATAESFPLQVPLTASGTLNASGILRSANLESALPLEDKTESRLQLVLTAARVTGLSKVGGSRDTLNLGTVTLAIKGRGRSFDLVKCESSGGDLQVSGEGQLMLAEPLGNSRANLTLSLTPTANADPSLVDLLGLLAQKGRDGSYRIRLRGTLAQAGLG